MRYETSAFVIFKGDGSAWNIGSSRMESGR